MVDLFPLSLGCNKGGITARDDMDAGEIAFVVRQITALVEAGGQKNRIPIEIKKIMTLKSADIPLHADDLLYIPNSAGQRIGAKALSLSLGVAFGVAGLALYFTR